MFDAEGRVEFVLQHGATEHSDLLTTLLKVFRNTMAAPQSVISGGMSLLRSGTLVSERREWALAAIERAAQELTDTVRLLLDLIDVRTERAAVHLVPIDIADVVGAAVRTVQQSAEASGIAVDAIIASVATIRGDHWYLQRALESLLQDAVRRMKVGERVTLRVETRGDEVELVVPGASSDLELMFVGRLIGVHGGPVERALDGEGTGATLEVRLPILRTGLTRQRSPSWWCVVPAVLEGLCVLVVSYDRDLRDHVCALLERCGVVVAVAASAGEALTELQRARPEVLLLDLGVPGEDGLELIRQIRTLPHDRGGRTPAIALTAGDWTELAGDELAEFQDHVGKPIEPTELLVVVSSLVAPPHFTG